MNGGISQHMSFKPYSRQQMRNAIEKGGLLPQTMNFWTYPSAYENGADVQALLEKHPQDVLIMVPGFPGYEKSPFPEYPEYKWYGSLEGENGAIDSRSMLSEWDDLDAFLTHMPDPELPPITVEARKALDSDPYDRYRLCHFWYLFYERLWSFRGMENALIDLCLNPEEVKRLLDVLCTFYIRIIDRMKREFDCDGVFVTDDLGTQHSLMFSPSTFREIFKPFYKRLIDACHTRGMHFWLHTCGNVTCILDDFVEIGVDVLHPVQKYAMDVETVARDYRGKLCFMFGIDVQQTLPNGTQEEVRQEARHLCDVFGQNGGRMIFSIGNGVTGNIPLSNLEALYDEVYRLRMQYREPPNNKSSE